MSSEPSHHRHPSQADHVQGPFSFFNPTVGYVGADKAHHHRRRAAAAAEASTAKARSGGSGDGEDGGEDDAESSRAPTHNPAAAPEKGVYQVWRSRDNRKGRHAIAISPESATKHGFKHPRATNTLGETLRGIAKMFVRYPVWDVSYDVAVIFTLGMCICPIISIFLLTLSYSQQLSCTFSGQNGADKKNSKVPSYGS